MFNTGSGGLENIGGELSIAETVVQLVSQQSTEQSIPEKGVPAIGGVPGA